MMRHVQKILLPLVFIGVSFLYLFSRSPSAAVAVFNSESRTAQKTSDTPNGTTVGGGETADASESALIARLDSLKARVAALAAAAAPPPRAKTTVTKQKPSISIPPPDPTPVPVLQPPPPAPLAGYTDGTYAGSVADATYGNVQVQVIISGRKIHDVVFLSHPTTPANSIVVNNRAMPILISEAIAAQSANVATVSGATYTSGAFQQSLASALASANSSNPAPVPPPPPPALPASPPPAPTPPPVSVAPPPAPAVGYTDGTYTGSVAQAGTRGPVQVQAVVSGGKITGITFLQHPTAASESIAIYNMAAPELIQEAIAAQSANVATVSGATLDTNAFQQSLASALASAGVATSTPVPAPTPIPTPIPTPTVRYHDYDD